MAVTLREGREVNGAEAVAERPDGERVPFRPYPRLLRDKQGHVIGAVNMLVDLTEQYQAQESLKASEDRYQQLLGMLPAAVYTCEAPSGEITFFNEHAAELWGRRPALRESDERFCGSWRLWLPDGTPLAHQDTPMARALKEGLDTRDRDIVIERPDGSRVSVLVNIDPIRDGKGAIVGAVNVFVDTSRIKETERELRRRTKQLAAFLETAAVGLHRVGPDGTILWANDAELEMLGYSREEYIGRNISEFHADLVVLEDILSRLRRHERLRNYEAQMKCKDGALKTVQIDSSALVEDGQFVHTQCFTRDITDRKVHERTLAGFAAIVDSSADAIISHSLEGLVTSWNESAERIYGYSPTEAIGRNVKLVIPEDKLEEEERVLYRLKQGERIEHFETERVTKQGCRVPVSLTASLIQSASGEILGVSKIVRDITE
jgi:PAS domain S-box-containing protein